MHAAICGRRARILVRKISFDANEDCGQEEVRSGLETDPKTGQKLIINKPKTSLTPLQSGNFTSSQERGCIYKCNTLKTLEVLEMVDLRVDLETGICFTNKLKNKLKFKF